MSDTNPSLNQKARYFEDFAVGQTLTTGGRTITEADITAFAAFSGDWTPIHTNAVYAAQTPYGQRIAHGLIGLAAATGQVMHSGILDSAILAWREILDWKFSLPIFIGDTLCTRITVTETRAVRRAGGGLVTLNVEILNQDQKIVQHGAWSVLLKGRQGGAAPEG